MSYRRPLAALLARRTPLLLPRPRQLPPRQLAILTPRGLKHFSSSTQEAVALETEDATTTGTIAPDVPGELEDVASLDISKNSAATAATDTTSEITDTATAAAEEPAEAMNEGESTTTTTTKSDQIVLGRRLYLFPKIRTRLVVDMKYLVQRRYDTLSALWKPSPSQGDFKPPMLYVEGKAEDVFQVGTWLGTCSEKLKIEAPKLLKLERQAEEKLWQRPGEEKLVSADTIEEFTKALEDGGAGEYAKLAEESEANFLNGTLVVPPEPEDLITARFERKVYLTEKKFERAGKLTKKQVFEKKRLEELAAAKEMANRAVVAAANKRALAGKEAEEIAERAVRKMAEKMADYVAPKLLKLMREMARGGAITGEEVKAALTAPKTSSEEWAEKRKKQKKKNKVAAKDGENAEPAAEELAAEEVETAAMKKKLATQAVIMERKFEELQQESDRARQEPNGNKPERKARASGKRKSGEDLEEMDELEYPGLNSTTGKPDKAPKGPPQRTDVDDDLDEDDKYLDVEDRDDLDFDEDLKPSKPAKKGQKIAWNEVKKSSSKKKTDIDDLDDEDFENMSDEDIERAIAEFKDEGDDFPDDEEFDDDFDDLDDDEEDDDEPAKKKSNSKKAGKAAKKPKGKKKKY